MAAENRFDVIVIGGGHAGIEAAAAAARIGVKTLLLTQRLSGLGEMSCNPAIGGIGKGHLVKEIDAMGGLMAGAIDYAGIQFRRLNMRKGPAVRATRAQADRALYKNAIQRRLKEFSHLEIHEETVEQLILKQNHIDGVITQSGIQFLSSTVVLAVGTFLGGQIYVGLEHAPGGRVGDPPSSALAEQLRALPFHVARLKTGTPPRLARSSIDYKQLTVQPGDDPIPSFSFMAHSLVHPPQVNCHITYTNERTHDIIRSSLEQSPLYTGTIVGIFCLSWA